MSIHNTLAGFATFISPINNLSVGVVTATQLYGDGSSLTNVGLRTTSSINTSGIVTASRFSGDGSGLTDVGGYLAGLIYSPAVGATGVGISSNISITFNKHIIAGVGTITLRTGSASGTIIESFNVGTSSSISISGATLTVNPTNNLSGLTTYYLVVPANTVEDTFGTGGNLGITSYSFTSQQLSYPLFGWGDNAYGQLAQNNTTQYSSPVQIPGITWNFVSAAYNNSAATKTDGTLWSWGYNSTGVLGQNNRTYASSPVQIPGTTWSSISGSSSHFIAIKTDGTLWSWGRNQAGQLGQNNRTYASSPVQIPGTTWNSISSGGQHLLATKTDNTLWAWGLNQYGQLGQNNTTRYSSPVQIPGTTWSSISGGGNHSIATKTDGTLWAWGINGNGQIGLNNLTQYSSPVQIPGTTWSSIAAGRFHSSSIKTDGTLWMWGLNQYGTLGQNDTTQYSSPRQVPGTTWSSIKSSSYSYHSVSKKTDGTLWAWGYNLYGQTGQSNTTSYSSPIQIPGTTWNSISAGNRHSLVTKAE